MKSIAAVLLSGAFCAVAAESTAAPERPGNEPQTGFAVDRAPVRSGESAAVAALLDSVDQELAAERPEQALALLERALRIEPRNAALWHYLGLANLELGHYARAEAMAAKSRSLAGGNRTLRTRNAGLTAAALRAQGKPMVAGSRDLPSLASRTELEPRLEPAVTYVDRGNRYASQGRAEQRRLRPSVEHTPQPAARAASARRPTREAAGTSRARRERAERRGECWLSAPSQAARRQPPTIRCDALNGQAERRASSSALRKAPAQRPETRPARRYGWNGVDL